MTVWDFVILGSSTVDLLTIFTSPSPARGSTPMEPSLPACTLAVRYAREVTDPGEPCVEENFRLGIREWRLPLSQCALVMVDCWSTHVVESHLKRGGLIAEKQILPVLQTFRAAGMTVVHAPAPETAQRYPEFLVHSEVQLPPSPQTAWPPTAFLQKEGDYACFAKPAEPVAVEYARTSGPRMILPCLEPVPGDVVIGNGEQLHRVCEERQCLHLFYCGFATNICVEHRDYGMRAMASRGYNVILLRDGTTGIELTAGLSAPVRPRLSMTQASILNLELKIGSSALCADVVDAVTAAARSARL